MLVRGSGSVPRGTSGPGHSQAKAGLQEGTWGLESQSLAGWQGMRSQEE